MSGTEAYDTSRDIIYRCVEGDQRAYRELYDLYATTLFNTAFRILNNVEEAEDVIQESFVDAFRNISGFESRSSFNTWLKRIVIHKCINVIKKRKVDVKELTEHHINTIAEAPIDETDIEWEMNRVLEAMKLLPDNYRIVVSLYLLEGYDHTEIAGIAKLPEATVRTQYNRGKKRLIEIIKTNILI